VLQRINDTPDGNQNVIATVVSSEVGDCAQGQTVVIPVQEIEERLNRMPEQIDAETSQLVANQVIGVHPPDPAFRQVLEGTADPVPDAAAALHNQENLATDVESQVSSTNWPLGVTKDGGRWTVPNALRGQRRLPPSKDHGLVTRTSEEISR